MDRKRLLIGGIVALVVVTIVTLFLTGIIPGLKKSAGPEINLTLWGHDRPQIWESIISEYKAVKPNVKIAYRQIDFENYEEDLINGLASPDAPDIFMFQNTWLPKHINKIVEAPESLMAVDEFLGTFPVAAAQDFTSGDLIFAMPLFMDTLALYYNQDIFDRKGIALPPQNWLAFQDLVKNKFKLGEVAFGGSGQSVDRASDILSLLMLQDGVSMVDGGFTGGDFSPQGLDALLFYAKFAVPESGFYVWNDRQSYSTEAFIDGKVAMTFNYRYLRPFLEETAPFLNFKVAPMLQVIGSEVNFPYYFGLTVSAQSRNYDEAWEFVRWATTNPDAAQFYADSVDSTPALRSLLAQAVDDPRDGFWARQALTARSWLQPDNNVIEEIFSQMIELILAGENPRLVLEAGEARVTDLIRRIRQ